MTTWKWVFPISSIFVGFFSTVSPAWGKMNVLATTTDLAALARAVGGERVDVVSPHIGPPGCSFRRSEAFTHPPGPPSGRIDPRRRRSRSGVGSRRFSVPRGTGRSFPRPGPRGRRRPCGSWMRPARGSTALRETSIRRGTRITGSTRGTPRPPRTSFRRGSPGSTPKAGRTTRGRADDFERLIGETAVRMAGAARAFRGTAGPNVSPVVGLLCPPLRPRRCRRTGAEKPGIPPSAAHLAKLVRKIKDERISILIKEAHYETQSARFLAERTGLRIVELPLSVGGAPGVETYDQLIDVLTEKLRGAFQEAGDDGGASILWPAAVMVLLLVGPHVYLGLHVLERGDHLCRSLDGPDGGAWERRGSSRGLGAGEPCLERPEPCVRRHGRPRVRGSQADSGQDLS